MRKRSNVSFIYAKKDCIYNSSCKVLINSHDDKSDEKCFSKLQHQTDLCRRLLDRFLINM